MSSPHMLPAEDDEWDFTDFPTSLHASDQTEIVDDTPKNPRLFYDAFDYDITFSGMIKQNAVVDCRDARGVGPPTSFGGLIYRSIKPDIKSAIISTWERMAPRVNMVGKKAIINRCDATGRAKIALDQFVSDTDHKELKEITVYIRNTFLSGRSIDLFLTTAVHLRNVCYYLTPDANGANVICNEGAGVCFNLSNSYKASLKSNTKAFFDCFGRGNIYRIETADGPFILPLCQYVFFKWAKKHCVVEFIESLVKIHAPTGFRFTTPCVRALVTKYRQLNVRDVSLIKTVCVQMHNPLRFVYMPYIN